MMTAGDTLGSESGGTLGGGSLGGLVSGNMVKSFLRASFVGWLLESEGMAGVGLQSSCLRSSRAAAVLS